MKPKTNFILDSNAKYAKGCYNPHKVKLFIFSDRPMKAMSIGIESKSIPTVTR